MDRIIRRNTSFLATICLTIVCLPSSGLGQLKQQVTLQQLDEAALRMVETGKPILVYMFDST